MKRSLDPPWGLLVAAFLSLSPTLLCQEEPEKPSPAAGSTRLIGPPLFPFYYHYVDTSDGTRVLHLLYLYNSTRRPNGDGSDLLVPFYYWQWQKQPPERRLFLFPLLFFHHESEELSYTFSPLYFDYRTPKDETQFLLPFWLHHRDLEAVSDTHHLLFPLSRYRSSQKDPASSLSAFRLGLWKILELFEWYNSKDESRVAALDFFNFKDEASSPLSIFHLTETATESRTHLFPFYWGGESASGYHNWIIPFFAFNAGGGDRDLFLLPFLSRFGSSDNGEVRRDILFPLYHRKVAANASSFFSLPFFSYSWTPERRSWMALLFLYGQDYDYESEKTVHSFLWPLGKYDVDADGVNGQIRLLPFYWDSFNDAKRLRLSPFLITYQRRAGTEVEWEFTYGLPTYFGFGSPQDYFAFAFPLFWHSRTGSRGWHLFLPLYYSFFSAASYGVHILPIFSFNNYPSEKQFFIGGPTFVHRRFYDFKDNPAGSITNLLWPLTAIENRPQGYHYRLLPFFWVSKERDEHDLLLFPFWYRQWGGERAQDYFFLLYGRYESAPLDRDFYLLGSYIHTQEKTEAGDVFRDRRDILWSLFSFQEDQQAHQTHEHLLPFGFWRTRSVPEDRTVLGPLYYSHRIDTEEASHRLELVGGNLWLSKEVVSEKPEASTLTEEGDSDPSEPSVVAREQGVLWPFFRWGFDQDGYSSQWALPIYFHRQTPNDRTLALFPLLFADVMEDRYRASYFRYFFLFDWESWRDGQRFTFGQLLFDWLSDGLQERYRWRFLYPLIEHEWNPEGYQYQVTPIMQGSVKDDGGERVSSHFLFPFYWSGARETKQPDGIYLAGNRHFYLFPFYGFNRKSLRTQHDFLLPFFHIQHGLNSFKFQLRPFFFFRDDPEELSVRMWPLHSFEKGESAGDWWISKYLYFSKMALRRARWSFRLDPFLFRVAETTDSFGIGGIFELWAYDQIGQEKSFRALPITYGYSHQKESGSGVFPAFYYRNFGDNQISYWMPWRFLFLTNHLRGNGTRYSTFLTLLAEYEDSSRRPDYSDFRFLFRMIQSTQTESSRRIAVFPFFYYSRDDAELRKTIFSLLPLYRYEETAGRGRHYIFWFIPIAGD